MIHLPYISKEECKMKKILTAIIIAALCLSVLAIFTACGEKTVNGIELSGSVIEDQNVKNGSELPEDLKVNFVYSDGSKSESVKVTSDMISGFDTATDGRRTATVTYEGYTATFDYRVYTNDIQLKFYDGNGTAESPYLITTAEELQNISQATDAYFRLEIDIDMKGVEWTPVGNNIDEESIFSGNFNGNGRTISNLSVTNINSANWNEYKNTYNYAGMFGASSGTISNLTLENCSVEVSDGSLSKRGDVYAGILVGQNFGDISGVTVKNSNITATGWLICSAGALVGSNVGNIDSCNAESCEVSATSDGWTANAGGVVGASGDRFYYMSAASVTGSSAKNCTVYSEVKSEVTVDDIDYPSATTYFGRVYAGGIGGLKVMTTYSDNTYENNDVSVKSYKSGEYIEYVGEEWGY